MIETTLDAIRTCLDGAIPGVIATCAPDGTPNVSYVSQVHYVDPEHVALSFQFFSKTRENALATGRATALVVDPATVAQYRIAMAYQRTESEGPLFESMKAKLAGIASHTGMSGVFRLLGADVYRVLSIEPLPGRQLPAPPARRSLLSAVRAFATRVAACADLAALLEEALTCLEQRFGIRHAMVLMAGTPGRSLYTVASRGYPESGVGSEIPFGRGVIGVCAEQRTPIRITYLTSAYAYGQAVRRSAQEDGLYDLLETEIPLPGLPAPRSQLAVPMLSGSRLLGVLFVEDSEELRFGYDDEDALVTIAAQLALGMHGLQQMTDAADDAAPREPVAAAVPAEAIVVRHYAADDSVFIDDDYLIKGVAGAIFCKLVRDYCATRRTEFSNRELRLDPAIRLPDVSDNLEARLILLQRRLLERSPRVSIEKTGRGRFRLRVSGTMKLVQVDSARAD